MARHVLIQRVDVLLCRVDLVCVVAGDAGVERENASSAA